MVWETHEVCEEARQLCLVSLHLPFLTHTNLKKALGRMLPTLYASTGLTPCLHILTMRCTRTLHHCLTTCYSLMIPTVIPAAGVCLPHSPPPHIYHPTRHVVVNIMTWAQCPLVQHWWQHQEARRGQCDTLATDMKNGWHNGKGYIASGKSSASFPSPLIPTTL